MPEQASLIPRKQAERDLAPRPRPTLPGISHDAGQPLESGMAHHFGTAFGYDFSAVRVHCDSDAARSADRLGAAAYTLGADIAFGTGRYQPRTRDGQRLIAHELAHVVQGRGSPAGGWGHAEPARSPAETEAHRAGTLVGLGLPPGAIRAPLAGLALTPASDQVVPLISYSATDWIVTAAEERQVLAVLRADPGLSATIADLNTAGMLRALLERVDEPENRRDLLRLLGARLNPAARALVEPIIQELGAGSADTQAAQIQYNLGRLGVSGPAAPFNRAAYGDLISDEALVPFTGSGATGVNPSERGYLDWTHLGRKMFDKHINAISDLAEHPETYLPNLTADQRRRQAELLVRQPISTNYAGSYAGRLPSRLQVIRAAAAANRVQPELVAAIILAEQRDQNRAEDARDFIGALMFGQDTSIGLGQVKTSTAKSNDLFADALTNVPTTMYAATTARADVNVAQMAWLLSSDEVNITAVARYLRILIDGGARHTVASLPNTKAEFGGFDPAAYANPPATWPEDNIAVLGMYYTSTAWSDDTGSAGWGDFVLEAYRDVKAAGLF